MKSSRQCIFILLFFLLAQSSFAQPVVSIDKGSVMLENRKREAAYIGKPYPAFSQKIGNKTYSNESLKGKVYFLNFWFATCTPCIAEFPNLAELYKQFNNDPGFEFLSLTYETPKTTAEFRTKYAMPYTILPVSYDDCMRLNLAWGFPKNIVVGKDGLVKYIGSCDDGNLAKYFAEVVSPVITKELSMR